MAWPSEWHCCICWRSGGAPVSDLLIAGGRVLDPARGFEGVADVLVSDGRIARVAPELVADGADRLDAGGLLVTPGFIDLHTHLREPGFEHKETIATGTRAAARGGFTTVCAMPNTSPPGDSAAAIQYVLRKAEAESPVRVLPIGCITRGRAGKELAEFGELVEAGAVALSDDGSPVADAALMRRALEYSTRFDVVVSEHAEDPVLTGKGVLHEGWVATRLGVAGVPAASEESAVQRDIALAELTGARLHIAHLSTARSVELVRRAKVSGLRVTAEVTPHHLTLTHEAALEGPGGLPYNTAARVNPPLRTREDVEACIDGLVDGTIDAIATDHAPHADIEKLVEFDLAPNGISGLETAFAAVVALAHSGRVPLSLLVERLTAGPARVFTLARRPGLEGIGTLAPGAPADLAIIDPSREWTVDVRRFVSKGHNTPYHGFSFTGRVLATVAGGSVAWREEAEVVA
jgi:dihydroorotase